MSAKQPGPDERPYDALLQRIGKALSWLSTGAICVVIPVCQARLPHHLAFGLAALACAGVHLAFLLLIAIGKRLGVVGAKLEIESPSTFEDEIQVPVRKIVPIQRDVTQDKVLGALRADEVAKARHVDVAGMGRVTYRLVDRRG